MNDEQARNTAIYDILSLFYRGQSNRLIQLIALIRCLYRQGGLLWSQSTAPAVEYDTLHQESYHPTVRLTVRV